MQVTPAIFKAYDIRGVVPDALNTDVAHALGRAFGAEALTQGERGGMLGSAWGDNAARTGLVPSGSGSIEPGRDLEVDITPDIRVHAEQRAVIDDHAARSSRNRRIFLGCFGTNGKNRHVPSRPVEILDILDFEHLVGIAIFDFDTLAAR